MKKLLTIAFLMLFVSHSFAQKFISSHIVQDETKTYSKILVVVKAKRATDRVQVEDDIVNKLNEKDITAVASYVLVPHEAMKSKAKDEKQLEMFVSKLREDKFDGILVTSLIEAKESVDYNPSQYRTSTVPVRYGRFGRYYGTATVGHYEPGSVEKHSNYLLESLLYDLRGSTKENSLHWIGKIKITDPSSFDKASHKYAKILVKRLVKDAMEQP